jgi:MoaA/NifB/PqqE/SkfB family radical SAM enzyme
MHKNVKILEIESTNTCNASCPQCLRTNEHGDIATDYSDVLDFDQVLANTTPGFWQGLDTINFNGNTGDNIAHPRIQNIVATLLKCAPDADIKISTNGGLRNASWWGEFGKLVAGTKCFVVFGIDGLEDTHSLHRVGTVWQRVIDNAKAFIDAGGTAVWQMIPFKHNEHQIDQCKQLSEQLGFCKFMLVSDNRFPANQTWQPVYFNQKETHTIYAPSIQPTSSICQSMEKLDATKKVNCKSIETNWMAIYADGTVWPCCFLMGWHKSPHQGRFYKLINYHFNKILGLDLSQINLYNNKLEDILNGDLWQKRYPDSFGTNPNPVCLQQCSI